MGRGLTKADSKALSALQLFLEDHDATHLDVEPMDRGFRIRAYRTGATDTPAYSSWGITITDAVTEMVRSVGRQAR